MNILLDRNSSYFILPGDRWSQTISYLYSKEYTLLEVLSIDNNGNRNKSIFSYNNSSDIEMKKDVVFLLEHFNLEHAFIKYNNQPDNIYKIYKDGNQVKVELKLYEQSSYSDTYVLGELTFSFTSSDIYIPITEKKQLVKGMEIEYFNNNKWNKKIVENIDLEWSKLYSLLSKYDKLRFKEKFI